MWSSFTKSLCTSSRKYCFNGTILQCSGEHVLDSESLLRFLKNHIRQSRRLQMSWRQCCTLFFLVSFLWSFSHKVFNEATSAIQLAAPMYSFLHFFFPTSMKILKQSNVQRCCQTISRETACLPGLSATSQQYFSLTINQHQPPANRIIRLYTIVDVCHDL